VVKQDFAEVDRAQAEALTSGFQNYHATQWSDSWRSSGWTSCGELIHEIVLAMSHKLKISALSGIHLSHFGS